LYLKHAVSFSLDILFFQKGEANSHPRNILDITKYKRRKERGIRTKTPSKPH
jgi:hypothetical protein